MAYTTINKYTDYFVTKLWTGNGSTQNITGLDFQPDLVYLKNRDASNQEPCIYDAIRGVQQRLFTSTTGGDSASGTGGLTAFNSDGYTLGSAGNNNGNGVNYVGWNWLGANGTSSNTDGSITSTVSANTTAGFSIVSYTGTGSNATVGHGLGVAPSMIIVKSRNSTDWWICYHKSLGATKYLALNFTNAEATNSGIWNDTEPTSSVFSIGTNGGTNGSSNNYIAYCFAEKTGYSRFGSYVGNGSNDGTFVYTGFKPVFLLIKNKGTTENWNIWDNKRDTYNAVESRLYPNLSDAESTSDSNDFDFLSNGFKVRNNGGNQGASGNTYIYMAFGQSLVGSNNIPSTAR